MNPLENALNEYIGKDLSRFHMPGHKGAENFPEYFKYDITEVEGADSLFEASEAIFETEKRFSKIYGTGASLLSAGGSTLCIQAMLATALNPGDKFIIARNCHASAVNTMALLDLEPIWINPRDLKGAEKAFFENPEAKAIYLTSPDYFGVLSDIEAFAKLAHEHGAKLLVDNAHGAHLHFMPTEMHPISLGADMCADSLHKSLPVLTGGALLHLKDGALRETAKQKMRLFGSTSPSYLIMLSADKCAEYLETKAKYDFAMLNGKVANLRYKAFEHGLAPKTRNVEPARLTLSVKSTEMTGEEFGKKLREHGIEPEYVNDEWAVLMASPFNTERDFERVAKFIEETFGNGFSAFEERLSKMPEKAMSVRNAVFSETEEIETEKAVGRISARLNLPCPPCIAFSVPGEVIDEKIAELLKKYGIDKINVIK
ncbi:MAG: aminotransferase class V-fold PLP-dependent enzyme [Oscillospiraceae bacterium]|nr:aminotransferase class V-fold PLP-dependent enzyme [Oscillospiraceae bacterium]MBR6657458.1 aminotransferase class V-fold PLP-dependent enzyme [Oscillospiraceae bacterium]